MRIFFISSTIGSIMESNYEIQEYIYILKPSKLLQCDLI